MAVPVKPAVAVVGGGWAGCAAAFTLAEAGVAADLFEAGRILGGRARGVSLDGRALDNGQHILLGAYAHCLDLIRRAGPGSGDLWRLPLAIETPPGFRFACPRLPAPLHLLAGLAGARGLDWRDKWRAGRWMQHHLRSPQPDVDRTVAELTFDQPDTVNRLLWHPLCISALNTPPRQASARVFLAVLRTAFGARRTDSDLLLPRRDLTRLFPSHAAERILLRGGTVHLACRIERIEAANGAFLLHTCEGARHYSHVIVAVAPQHLSRLTAGLPELESARSAIADFRYLPIATGYVQYTSDFQLGAPLYALDDGPAQFVFDRGQSHGQPGMMAFVASTATRLPADWLDQAEAQLRRFAAPGAARWRRHIVEKQATYACEPDLARPSIRTAHPCLFLAGDYTDGPYPATLESAASSGVQSALALLDSL
ncbi:MAG: phytoene dehydrogenase [Thiobacillus sp. 65-69]|nr:MAG: phytoene dehydrogenase [Thiobacillus sp. SCN 65-179]OJW38820.1 MAG: phytoene dehydrogenase [Thiobacillus sp. 65-69]